MSTSLEKLFEENDVFKNPANEIKSPTPPADKLQWVNGVTVRRVKQVVNEQTVNG